MNEEYDFIDIKSEELDNAKSTDDKIKIYQEIVEYCDIKKEETKDDPEQITEYQFFIFEKSNALNGLLEIYEDKNDYETQDEVLDELIANEEVIENKNRYLSKKVNLCKILNKFQEAIELQKKIIEVSKKTVDYYEIIELFTIINDIENKQKYQRELVDVYNRLIEEKKDNKTIVNSYRLKVKDLLIDLNEYKNIPKLFDSLIETDKAKSITYTEELAEFYITKANEYFEAIKQFNILISLNTKKEVEYLERIALLYEKISNYDEVVSTYEDLIIKNSSKEEFYLNEIVRIYTDKIKNYEKALETYNILEAKFDKNFYQEKIAEFHLQYTKENYKAIELYENVGEHYSNKARCDEIIASIYEEKLKEYDNAINQYEELIKSNPINKIIYQKSIIRLYWNDKEDLKSTIEKILEFFGEIPEDKEIRTILNKARKKELETKGKIGENFEETEKEFKKVTFIYLLIVVNIVFLLVIINKDIFYEKKSEIKKETPVEKKDTNGTK